MNDLASAKVNTDEDGFVTIEKVAQYFAVAAATVRVWVRDGVIPKDCYIKIGRTYRFKLDAITDAFLRANIETAANRDVDNETVNLDFSEDDFITEEG